MMMIRLRQNKLFKLIAIRIAWLLIFNQLAYAYASDTLAPPTTIATKEGKQELLDEMKKRSSGSEGDDGIGVTQSPSAILPHRGLKHVNDRIVRALGKHLKELEKRAEERGMTAEERARFRRFEQWFSRAVKLAESEGKPLDRVPLNRKLPVDKIKDEEDREVFDELGRVIARLKVVRLPVKELGRVKQLRGTKEEPFYGHVGFEEGVIWVAADRDDIEVELTIMHEMKEYKRAWEEANERGKDMAWMAEFRDGANFYAWEFFNYAHVDAWKDVVADCKEDYDDLENEYKRHKGTIAFGAAKDEEFWERRERITERYEAKLEIMGERLRRARDYLKIAQEAEMTPASKKSGIGVVAGSQPGETPLKAAVEATDFDERLYSSEYFDVYCMSSDPHFPVVMIPKHRVSREQVEFAKEHMGGIVPPFTILENVTVQAAGIEYEDEPFVIVQKRTLKFDRGGLPEKCKLDKKMPRIWSLDSTFGEEVDVKSQVHELRKKSIERGIEHRDTPRSEHYGMDPDNGNLYVVDFIGAHFAEFTDARDSEQLPRWKRGKSKSKAVAEDKWGKMRGRSQPVPEVELPSVGGAIAKGTESFTKFKRMLAEQAEGEAEHFSELSLDEDAAMEVDIDEILFRTEGISQPLNDAIQRKREEGYVVVKMPFLAPASRPDDYIVDIDSAHEEVTPDMRAQIKKAFGTDRVLFVSDVILGIQNDSVRQEAIAHAFSCKDVGHHAAIAEQADVWRENRKGAYDSDEARAKGDLGKHLRKMVRSQATEPPAPATEDLRLPGKWNEATRQAIEATVKETRHVTRFYRHYKEGSEREKEAFDKFIDGMVEKARQGEQISILCAGCSSGEETYTIAIELLRRGVPEEKIRIVGVDIAPDVVHHANAGIYDEGRITPTTPEAVKDRYFNRTSDGRYEVNGQLRRIVKFETCDLSDRAKVAQLGRFDGVTFMRVFHYIYLESEDRFDVAFENLKKALPEDGLLLTDCNTNSKLLFVRRSESGTGFKVHVPAPKHTGRRVYTTPDELEMARETKRYFAERFGPIAALDGLEDKGAGKTEDDPETATPSPAGPEGQVLDVLADERGLELPFEDVRYLQVQLGPELVVIPTDEAGYYGLSVQMPGEDMILPGRGGTMGTGEGQEALRPIEMAYSVCTGLVIYDTVNRETRYEHSRIESMVNLSDRLSQAKNDFHGRGSDIVVCIAGATGLYALTDAADMTKEEARRLLYKKSVEREKFISEARASGFRVVVLVPHFTNVNSSIVFDPNQRLLRFREQKNPETPYYERHDRYFAGLGVDAEGRVVRVAQPAETAQLGYYAQLAPDEPARQIISASVEVYRTSRGDEAVEVMANLLAAMVLQRRGKGGLPEDDVKALIIKHLAKDSSLQEQLTAKGIADVCTLALKVALGLKDAEGGAGVTQSRVGVMPHRGKGYVNDCIVRALGDNLEKIAERLEISKDDPDYVKFNTWYKGKDKTKRVDRVSDSVKIPIDKLSREDDYQPVDLPDGNRINLRIVRLDVEELGRINGEPFYGHIGFEEGVIWVAAKRDPAEVAVTIMHEAKEYKIAYLKAQQLGCDMKTMAAWRDGKEKRWGGYKGALEFFNRAHIRACRATITAYEDEREEIAGIIPTDEIKKLGWDRDLYELDELLYIARRHLREAGETTRQAPPKEAGAAVIASGKPTGPEVAESDEAELRRAVQEKLGAMGGGNPLTRMQYILGFLSDHTQLGQQGFTISELVEAIGVDTLSSSDLFPDPGRQAYHDWLRLRVGEALVLAFRQGLLVRRRLSEGSSAFTYYLPGSPIQMQLSDVISISSRLKTADRLIRSGNRTKCLGILEKLETRLNDVLEKLETNPGNLSVDYEKHLSRAFAQLRRRQEAASSLPAEPEGAEGGAGVTQVGVLPHRGDREEGTVNDEMLQTLKVCVPRLIEQKRLTTNDAAGFLKWYETRTAASEPQDRNHKLPIEKLVDKDRRPIIASDGRPLRVVKLPVDKLGIVNGKPFYGHVNLREGIIWVAAEPSVGRDELDIEVDILHEAQEYNIAAEAARKRGWSMPTMALWRDGKYEDPNPEYNGFETAKKFFRKAHVDAWDRVAKACLEGDDFEKFDKAQHYFRQAQIALVRQRPSDEIPQEFGLGSVSSDNESPEPPAGPKGTQAQRPDARPAELIQKEIRRHNNALIGGLSRALRNQHIYDVPGGRLLATARQVALAMLAGVEDDKLAFAIQRGLGISAEHVDEFIAYAKEKMQIDESGPIVAMVRQGLSDRQRAQATALTAGIGPDLRERSHVEKISECAVRLLSYGVDVKFIIPFVAAQTDSEEQYVKLLIGDVKAAQRLSAEELSRKTTAKAAIEKTNKDAYFSGTIVRELLPPDDMELTQYIIRLNEDASGTQRAIVEKWRDILQARYPNCKFKIVRAKMHDFISISAVRGGRQVGEGRVRVQKQIEGSEVFYRTIGMANMCFVAANTPEITKGNINDPEIQKRIELIKRQYREITGIELPVTDNTPEGINTAIRNINAILPPVERVEGFEEQHELYISQEALKRNA